MDGTFTAKGCDGCQIDDGPREHFIECPACGALFDMRDLRRVLEYELEHEVRSTFFHKVR